MILRLGISVVWQIETLTHARKKLATPDAQFIPCRSRVIAAPIEWRMDSVAGLRADALNGGLPCIYIVLYCWKYMVSHRCLEELDLTVIRPGCVL